MLLRSILLIPFALQTVMCDNNIIPVFMVDQSGAMGDLQVDANPFHKMSTAQFADIVQVSIKEAAVTIVFIEDQFCVEDISTKDALGTPYRHLRTAFIKDKVKYFPKVIEPYKLLKHYFQPHQFNVFHVSTEMNFNNDMMEGKLKHLYVFFRDGKNETRVEKLRRHDEIMREVYMMMTKMVEGPVLAFYTGKMNPIQVDKVDFVPILPNPSHSVPGVTVITNGALFWFFGVFAVTPTRRALFSQMPILAEETWTDQALSTRMAYSDFDLEFNFKFSETGWILENVMLFEGGEEVGRTNMVVSAPWYHAYYCGEPIVVINNRDGSSVTISEYKQTKTGHTNNETIIAPAGDGIFIKGRESYLRQREPTATAILDEEEPEYTIATEETGADDDESECEFGSSVNCGPYFSVGILSALFVVGICLFILGFGLAAINDIKTNDRYDDARGKMLVLGIER